MRISEEQQDDGYYAAKHPLTREFFLHYQTICRFYGMVIVPTDCGEINFHDQMRVVPLDEEAMKFLLSTSVCVTD
jgi:hypothetical protein